MYKVFINDKEIRFLKNSEDPPRDGVLLDTNLSAAEIVSRIQIAGNTGKRIFYGLSDDPSTTFKNFTDYFALIRAAGGVVRQKNSDGPVLMIHRSGKWDLPKGKIDAGESEEEAAIREVEEECGIKGLQILKKLTDTYHLYEFRGVMVLKITSWFLMISDFSDQLQPQLEEGISEVKWIAEKDIYFLLPLSYASISDLLTGYVLIQRNA